jgi:branched-chain amino acid transport system permease protein
MINFAWNWDDLIFFLTDVLQYLINGIVQGSIYALVALGYTMVYGIIRLVNFAHGEFYMVGAFIGHFAISVLHLNPWLAFGVSMLGSGLLAVLVEKLVYRPIRSAGRISALITALGASLFLQNFGQVTVGAEPRPFPQVFEEKTYFWGEISISSTQILIVGVTLFLMVALWWFVQHTRLGKAMRATSYGHDAAMLMGINIDRVITLTFFVGASLAGAAGVLVGMYYNTIDPMMGMVPGMKAFVAAVLGGIGVIPGAVVGGLVLGIAENLVVGLWESTFRDAVAFAILILILLIRPSGLLGKNVREKV